MDIYTFKGKVAKIMEVDLVTDKFSKQEFVINVFTQGAKGTYSEYIKLQAINDKILKLSDVNEGDFCQVHFRLSGRKYKKEGKEEMYFTNLVMEDIQVLNKATEAVKEVKPSGDYAGLYGIDESQIIKKEKEKDFFEPITEENDLPF